MRDMFFLEDLFKYSVKAPYYEDCETPIQDRFEEIGQAATIFVHKFISRKGGKAALVYLQSNVKVLEIMKLRHKDRPWAITMFDLFLEDLFNYSIKAPCYEDCEERLSKITSKKLDKQQMHPRSHKPKRRHKRSLPAPA